MEELELRMYGLVNYQLTGIQKGIQFLHGVVEYGQTFKNHKLYNDWADNWKTVILLNGGTTSNKLDDDGIPFGTLNQHSMTLAENGIDFEVFNEPDLGDQLTNITFIVDERVFNKKKYPNFVDWLEENNIFVEDYRELIENSEEYNNWSKLIGGEKNIFLRDFLKNFRLA